MPALVSSNPHIRDGSSPLSKLVIDALRVYGEYHPSTIDSDLALMMLGLGNTVLDDYRTHPYWTSLADAPVLHDYTQIDDARPVHDRVMTQGLLAYYCVQQGSQKMGLHVPRYQSLLNRTLWHDLSGSGPISLSALDEGPSRSHRTDPITGKRLD
ncbi:hypothetical protein [Poseidonocella sp. HB161398]|uniref:hypothetical protein n=1 Tax=Poseidonocella sp. HB161398 TaxID=2320855 RepID=UPI001109CAFE|nr:hypothetical protein [Poseidonocella sp. HB161398]